MVKDIQVLQQQKNGFNSVLYSSKNINEHGKKSTFEDEYIRIIGTRPEISRTFLSIGIKIEIPQTHRFSGIKTDHNWQIVCTTWFIVLSNTNCYLQSISTVSSL